MTSRSRERKSAGEDRRDYGFARARDLAFDAVQSLWRRRRDQGMKQLDIAKAIDRQPAWVSRNLRGPGNWTMRTLGELVEALNGEIEITVRGVEDPVEDRKNSDAYTGFEPPIQRRPQSVPPMPTQSPGGSPNDPIIRKLLEDVAHRNNASVPAVK